MKIHFRHANPDRFPENPYNLSAKQGKKLHQDIHTMEERYDGY